ncbi:antibiotic biosynthesis monooxygenase [Balneolaceae bacterium YR4-1]|uniref:Antibiotic biosynthesis monooxygenase n=1 Tax=Halalkalibaculum roseum TaxID=2709311 RepID=A0A6M1TCH6_9BACT|nr:antibiotic biosynthesis monooxygenase [Halalkalibaculum roseum]NGP77833.1 antibiotic biosynthesis monooxygenase [Halalkalibaculum roseum]
MLVRLLETTLIPGKLEEFESVYLQNIIPVLRETPGCIFAGLLQNISTPNQVVSLTMWKNSNQIDAYVKSGAFEKNTGLVRPYMKGSSEWKIQLSKEHKLNYEPINNEPTIRSYRAKLEPDSVADQMTFTRKYLRILSLSLISGKKEEFNRIYYNDIQPELAKVPGCHYAFIIDNSENENEVLSFTIWNNLEAVERYEKKGTFRGLLQKVQHTLAELYQWKMSLENQASGTVSVSNRDIDISKFTLVFATKF